MSTPWTEVEIHEMPALSPEEANLVDMHSVLNAVSLLVGELNLIGQSLEKDLEWMKEGLAACREVVTALKNRERSINFANNLSSYRLRINRDIDRALTLHPGFQTDPDIIESISNIDSVFVVLALRAREILARVHSPERWESVDIVDLIKSFQNIFAAIERNSKGRYRIAFNSPRESNRDYEIQFDVESCHDEMVVIPPVLVDVMRDLMANARKYSLPGATITAKLSRAPRRVTFVVEDTGRGIPEKELQSVVAFGQRGSNVGNVRTMGGGFGLTKAYLVTQQFGGKMWIASRIGEGTRIRIEIPAP